MWNYDQLEVLNAIVENESFGAASKRLHITQPAVSQRLKALEDEVGSRVLVRGSPPRLTKVGELLVAHFRRIRQLEQELHLNLESPSINSYRTVSLGVNNDSLATWFIDALEGAFDRDQLLFNLTIENESHTFTRLRNGEVLGCISTRAKALAGFDIEKVGSLRYRCVSTPDFKERYFSTGFRIENISKAPAVLYNQHDDVHDNFLELCFQTRFTYPFHTVPNSHGFLDFIYELYFVS